ncbi:MAG: hypothetical protein HYT16_01955 [DPANN group archaeon]|nr:hypothetical protein [DPANN group archaeon]
MASAIAVVELTGRKLEINYGLFRILEKIWLAFARQALPAEFSGTDVFDSLHKIKVGIIHIRGMPTELQKLEAERKINFALERVREFSSLIFARRNPVNAKDLTAAYLNIIQEITYLKNMLMRAARS